MYHTAQDVCASHGRAVYVGRIGEGGGTKYGWKTPKIKGTSDMTKKILGGLPCPSLRQGAAAVWRAAAAGNYRYCIRTNIFWSLCCQMKSKCCKNTRMLALVQVNCIKELKCPGINGQRVRVVVHQQKNIDHVDAFPELICLQKRLNHKGLRRPAAFNDHLPNAGNMCIACVTVDASPLFVIDNGPDFLYKAGDALLLDCRHNNLKNNEHMAVQSGFSPQELQISVRMPQISQSSNTSHHKRIIYYVLVWLLVQVEIGECLQECLLTIHACSVDVGLTC